MQEDVVRVFNENVNEYEDWFIQNHWAYQTELEAVRQLIPFNRKGIEIGVGSGRFAVPLGIGTGVDISENMLAKAREYGVNAIVADANALPFEDNSFDFALMVVSICFMDDPFKALSEAKRVVNSGGKIIVGIVDKDSELGRIYLKKKQKSKFYRYARFFSSNEVLELFKKVGIEFSEARQCLFSPDISSMNKVGPVKYGYGQGGFVALSGEK